MSSRNMSLLPRATLHSDSEQVAQRFMSAGILFAQVKTLSKVDFKLFS
jgi:hypothetical protein